MQYAKSAAPNKLLPGAACPLHPTLVMLLHKKNFIKTQYSESVILSKSYLVAYAWY